MAKWKIALKTAAKNGHTIQFQYPNMAYMTIEVLDLNHLKQTYASTLVNVKSRATIFMICL